MILVALGIAFVSWASFGLPTPYWQSPAVVWLAGVICVGLGWIDLRLGERRHG